MYVVINLLYIRIVVCKSARLHSLGAATNWMRPVQMSQITTGVYKKNALPCTSLLAGLSINMKRQEVPAGLLVQEILVNSIFMNELKSVRMKFPIVEIKEALCFCFFSFIYIGVTDVEILFRNFHYRCGRHYAKQLDILCPQEQWLSCEHNALRYNFNYIISVTFALHRQVS